MVDQPNVVAPTQAQTQLGSDPNEILRQTEHRAVSQAAPPGMPEVSYEAEDFLAEPPSTPTVSQYQPPSSQVPLTQVKDYDPSSIPTFASRPEPVAPSPNSRVSDPPPTSAPTPTSASASPNSDPLPSTLPSQASQTAQRFPGVQKPPEEEVVLAWESLSRPFKKRSRQFYSTGLIIIILVSMILFFIQQFLPIAVVVAFGFLGYVLSVVPPGLAKHKITTFGIRIEDNLYYWQELGRFWYTEKYGQKILHVEVARIPWRLSMLLGEISETVMTDILSEVLINQQPKPTAVEKASDWIQAKIPLDSDPE